MAGIFRKTNCIEYNVRITQWKEVAFSFSFAGLLSDSLSMLLDVLCCQVGCLSAEKKT